MLERWPSLSMAIAASFHAGNISSSAIVSCGKALVKEVNAERLVLDGEIVVTDHLGRSVFADMMQRRPTLRLSICCGSTGKT